jgi:hypothetical protein
MKTLWVFGASMSMAWNEGGINESLKDWTQLLANNLKCDTIENHSGAGNSNFEILWKFITNRDKIQSNDIVIFQFVHFEHIKLFPSNVNITELPYWLIEKMGGLDSIIHTDNQTYIKDTWEKLLVNWCKKNNISFLCWFTGGDEHIINRFLEVCRENCIHIPDSSNKFGIFDDWQVECESQWLSEKDKHFNELGHRMFFENIITQINDRKIINNG